MKIPVFSGRKKGKIISRETFYAEIDDEDYDLVSEFSWFPSFRPLNVIYALAKNKKHMRLQNNQGQQISMHRLIMGFPEKKEIHHIDGNGLNNKKENLYICDKKENLKYRRSWGKSKTTGVIFNKRKNLWEAHIYLGQFITEKEAIKARKSAEKLLNWYPLNN